MRQVLLGITDRTVTVFIPDSASTDGSGKTGLVAANLTVSYTRVETDNDVVVTDVTSSLNNLANLTAAHNDWGLFEVSNTLAPGLYRLDIADAVFASGAWEAVVYVMVTTSAAAASPIGFDLVAYDPLDAVPAADVTQWLGQAVAAVTVNGVPEVDITHIAGSAVSTSTAQLGVNAVQAGGTAWASGSLTSGVFASGAITATAIATDAIGAAELADGAITAATFASGAVDATALAADAVAEIADGVWDEVASGHVTAGTFGQAMYIKRSNTAQTGDAGTITLDASASATDDFYINDLITITAGTGVGQARFITDYVGSTKVATVSSSWLTSPANDSVFIIQPFPPSIAADLASIASDISGIDSNVEAILDDTSSAGVVVASVLTDAITADAIDDDAITEIQDGLATASALATVATYVDTEVAAILAAVDTEIGTLTTNVSTVDTVVDAIKLKTDSLTFNVAGHVDANVQRVNDVVVTGSGAEGDEWGP